MPESSHGRSAAVVGTRGFVGRALTVALHDRGVRVVPVGRGDLLDPTIAAEVARCTTIFWAASSINPALATERPELVAADRDALDGLLAVLDDRRSIARVVFLSSGGTVYVGGEPPHREDSLTAPSAAYGEAKLAMERALRARRSNTVSLRVSNVYGPGQAPAPGQGVIAHWLNALDRREPIRVFGSLESRRDYLYIDDLVEALLAVHDHQGELPEILNVGSGRPVELGEVLRLVETAAANHSPIVEVSESRSFDITASWLDCSAIASSLGWSVRTPLEDGINAMWEWTVEASRHRLHLG